MQQRSAFICASLAVLSISCATASSPAMSRQRMESFIAESSGHLEGSPGAVQFSVDGVQMACISDVEHDRIRILAPIAPRAELHPQVLDLMLIANYHTALDARYAVSEGVVYAVFLHPLSALTKAELESALRQVASLAKTFGTSYSSGELVFGAPSGEPL